MSRRTRTAIAIGLLGVAAALALGVRRSAARAALERDLAEIRLTAKESALERKLHDVRLEVIERLAAALADEIDQVSTRLPSAQTTLRDSEFLQLLQDLRRSPAAALAADGGSIGMTVDAAAGPGPRTWAVTYLPPDESFGLRAVVISRTSELFAARAAGEATLADLGARVDDATALELSAMFANHARRSPKEELSWWPLAEYRWEFSADSCNPSLWNDRERIAEFWTRALVIAGEITGSAWTGSPPRIVWRDEPLRVVWGIAPAAYDASDRVLLICDRAFEPYAQTVGIDPLSNESAVLQMLVHEATHAIDRRDYPELSRPRRSEMRDRELVHIALIEGHAEWVSLTVARLEGSEREWMRLRRRAQRATQRNLTRLPKDLPTSVRESLDAESRWAALYDVGRAAIEAVVRERGDAGIRDILLRPPERVSDLEELSRGPLSPRPKCVPVERDR